FSAQNVGGHQVWGELNAARVKAEDNAHGFDELGLGQPRDADEQRVAPRQNRNQRLLDHFVLAEDHGANRGLGGLEMRGRRFGGRHYHIFEFFKALSHACSLTVPASRAAASKGRAEPAGPCLTRTRAVDRHLAEAHATSAPKPLSGPRLLSFAATLRYFVVNALAVDHDPARASRGPKEPTVDVNHGEGRAKRTGHDRSRRREHQGSAAGASVGSALLW